MNLSPEKLFTLDCAFVMGVAAPDGLPPARFPEIAFVGRSNVGKSSLINALTGRRGLARASNTPGRTREINFFLLGKKELMLVDLPGYGFAKVSKTETARWGELITAYLANRPNIKRVLILIDARHGIKPSDEMMMDMLDVAGVSYMLTLTKSDKIGPTSLAQTLAATTEAANRHVAAFPMVIATSAQDKSSMKPLRAALAAAAKNL